VIGDEYADPAFGSGCVKITPGHDFNDYEVGKRHNLPLINIFDANAALNDEVPQKYRGLDRKDARKLSSPTSRRSGLLEKVEPHTLQCRAAIAAARSRAVADRSVVRAHRAARRARIKPSKTAARASCPESWSKEYFQWMNKIQDWCVSRQLWWGHRIPRGTTRAATSTSRARRRKRRPRPAHRN
jgi:valyl-tRNA synthetase